jgi:glycerol uptake facilitator-like aquaporin
LGAGDGVRSARFQVKDFATLQNQHDRWQRCAAELVGTALLLATVVGSGIMGERLSGGNVALALLANSVATGAVLVALILALGPISGAHFNPLVSAAEAARRRMLAGDLIAVVPAQVIGAIVGVVLGNAMFDEPMLSWSTRERSGLSQALSELVATFGLLTVILGCSRRRDGLVAFAVGGYIAAAYWFTASTSFANPAVTVARMATNTFSGIRPADVPAFLVAQVIGATLATLMFRSISSASHEPDETPRLANTSAVLRRRR